jgi:3-phosphoshikimate 1-carboxyvinyltransferase
MNHSLFPARTLSGLLRVPSDRSITVRALLLAGLAEGTSRVICPLESEDTEAAKACMAALGVPIAIQHEGDLPALRITGQGLRGLRAPAATLFCHSSGTTMRLLAGLLTGQTFGAALDGSDQLRRRPMRRVTDPLRAMGARIEDTNGCAPLRIYPARGPLRGMCYAMPVASAQVKSALLLAGLYADAPVTISEPAPTRDHTERMLGAAGARLQISHANNGAATVTLSPPTEPLRALDIRVPADFSSAAFFLVAASLVPGACLRLSGVGLNATRTGLLDALRAMGARIAIADLREEGGEPVGDIEVCAAELTAIEVGGPLVPRMIDEFPIFAVAATQAHGVTVVRNAEELRVKESNRLEGFLAELRKLGARAEPTADGFVIEGPTRLRGAVVDGLGDHRAAMALAVAALVAAGQTTILGADCVTKTYPGFFDDLARVATFDHDRRSDRPSGGA